MRNKGFSLIELIVAMGIGSVVLLMIGVMLVRGTGMFKSENDEVNLRNDYQVIRNQIDEIIMEAKTLVIEKRGEDKIVYTGELDINNDGRNFLAGTKQTTEKVIYFDSSEKSIYISGSYDGLFDTNGKLLEGNKISDCVNVFAVNLIQSEQKTEKDELGNDRIYYTNPLRVSVTLTLENSGGDVATTFSINLRNRLKEVAIYTTANGANKLALEHNVEKYMVK